MCIRDRTWDVQYFWVALGLAVGGGILNSFGGIVGVIGSLALLGTALMNVVALYKLCLLYTSRERYSEHSGDGK